MCIHINLDVKAHVDLDLLLSFPLQGKYWLMEIEYSGCILSSHFPSAPAINKEVFSPTLHSKNPGGTFSDDSQDLEDPISMLPTWGHYSQLLQHHIQPLVTFPQQFLPEDSNSFLPSRSVSLFSFSFMKWKFKLWFQFAGGFLYSSFVLSILYFLFSFLMFSF